MTHKQIYEARMTWINFLLDPKRKKATGQLSRGGEKRCCLGHACAALDPMRNTNWFNTGVSLPIELVRNLGMWSGAGRVNVDSIQIANVGEFLSLTQMNDNTKMSPQEIGNYLLSVVKGGDNTPFKPIRIRKEWVVNN